tara:strand:+ start:95 stop:292 length:198 start_codon:yes stop_codon:yes gene_type:complete
MKVKSTNDIKPINNGKVDVPNIFPFATEYSVTPHELNVNREVLFTKLNNGLPIATIETRMIIIPK